MALYPVSTSYRYPLIIVFKKFNPLLNVIRDLSQNPSPFA